jgi:murein DD-endopeptidase MepM/ murein hydrolase activator NlpD
MDTKIGKIIVVIALIILGLCAALSLSGYYVARGTFSFIKDYGTLPDFGRASTPGGAPPPGRGTCANIGVKTSSPFRGWPVNFHRGDWRSVAAWFCDPDYFPGYTHWGIDLARIEAGTILQAEVLCTARYARVIAADESGSWNSGMGNFVKIEALDPLETCTYVDTDHDGYPDYNYCEEIPGEYEETGWIATFMHLYAVNVSEDEIIERGDLIGWVDSTGNSTGHHLHYQINAPNGGGAIDPAPTMCKDYDDYLRGVKRWNLPTCAELGDEEEE